MLTKLLEQVSGKLQDRFSAHDFVPAIAFWTGGIVIAADKYAWTVTPLTQDSIAALVVLLGALLILVASTAFVQRLDFSMLRFLEGYWPQWWPWSWLKSMRIQSYCRKRMRLHEKLVRSQRTSSDMEVGWMELQARVYELRQTVTPAEGSEVPLSVDVRQIERAYCERLQGRIEAERLSRQLERQYRSLPAEEQLMPTLLGNVLRAAELQPLLRYGLDAVTCYSRLWQVLPSESRENLASGRAQVNDAARLVTWSALFAGWPLYLWHFGAATWAVPVGALGALLGYRLLCHAAETFGDVLLATFDMQRLKLYTALRWPLPASPADEPQRGAQLTAYLLGRRDEVVQATQFTRDKTATDT